MLVYLFVFRFRSHDPYWQRASHQRDHESGQNICRIMDTKIQSGKCHQCCQDYCRDSEFLRKHPKHYQSNGKGCCGVTWRKREILRFGDHRDESFNFRKRPWSCHYIFEKQVGNDRPEDQGQGCRIACFSCLWNSKKNNCTEDPEPSSVSRNVTDFINGVSISVLKYRWIRRRISPSSCCIDCKIFIYLLLIRRYRNLLCQLFIAMQLPGSLPGQISFLLFLYFSFLYFSADRASFFYISASAAVWFTYYLLYCIFLDFLITKAKYFINKTPLHCRNFTQYRDISFPLLKTFYINFSFSFRMAALYAPRSASRSL